MFASIKLLNDYINLNVLLNFIITKNSLKQKFLIFIINSIIKC